MKGKCSFLILVAAAKLDLMATGEELDAWLLDLSEEEK